MSEKGSNWRITLIDWCNILLPLKNPRSIALRMCIPKIIPDFQYCVSIGDADFNLRWNYLIQPRTNHVIIVNPSINGCWSFYKWRRKSDSAINKTKFILCNQSLLHGSSPGMVILTSQNFRHEHSSKTFSMVKIQGIRHVFNQRWILLRWSGRRRIWRGCHWRSFKLSRNETLEFGDFWENSKLMLWYHVRFAKNEFLIKLLNDTWE